MALVTRDEAKAYLRVDSSDDDQLIDSLLSSAEAECADVARLTYAQWKAVDGQDGTDTSVYSDEKLDSVRSVMKVAVLYTLGYLYEHREEADHHDLTLTLRNLLFAVREGVVA